MRILVVGLVIIMASSCYNDNKEDLYKNYQQADSCDLANVSYNNLTNAILTNNCALSGCHNSSTRQSQLDLSSYADAAKIANDGRLVGHITGALTPKMPPAGTLSSCEIKQLTQWADEGAPQ